MMSAGGPDLGPDGRIGGEEEDVVIRRLALLLGAGAALAACGGSTADGHAYLNDVAPYNSASNTFFNQANPSVQSSTSAFDEAIVAFRNKLDDQNWPSSAERDVHAEAATLDEMHSEIASSDGWSYKFGFLEGAADRLGTEADAVRADLGLPAASSPGSSSPSASAQPSSFPLGTKVTVPVTWDGIAAVEVAGFYPNVTSTSQYDESPDPGTTWAAIDATECASTSGSSTGANSGYFALLLSNGSTAETGVFASGPLSPPQLAALNELGGGNESLAPGQCDRGWVLFSVPDGATPTFVQFSGTTASLSQGNSIVKWPAS